MKVKYLGKSEGISLTKNKIYEALGYESGFIRIIDDTEEDYLYDQELFEIVDED
ncbi:hypothetical protein [Peptoniphilus asaccharolyticus]